MKILRFAHCFNSGGGTERYLEDLDTALLAKNPFTIFRIQFSETGEKEISEKQVGLGKVITIGLPRHSDDKGPKQERTQSRAKEQFRNHVLYNPLVWNAFTKRKIANYALKKEAGQVIGAGVAAKEIFRNHKIDLCMMHFFGGSDAEEVILAARKVKVPIAVQNHYSNDRFLHLAIRKHAMLADATSGVNSLQVPKYLKGQFHNLSDGIDTEFFTPIEIDLEAQKNEQVILLPARVVPEKGQEDLIEVLSKLHQDFPKARIAFAGRATDEVFNKKLRQKAEQYGILQNVEFLGDLDVHQLKQQYQRSSLVAFPSYHHEGLGRIIVEAQSMEKPVVAYATGGVPDGIKDEETGFLVKTGDIKGMTQKLAVLLRSDNHRTAMGQKGRKYVLEYFSLEALAARHLAFYQEVAVNKSTQK
ncbi:glycosyltransferase family 4 protein [Pelagicoccus sp. SDUM812003]|uniref:glycosyltransferase family 4 protein n=1 Tax=Pelagicoccus sp. SDUM812003 TaxID=3041267 RepID=UPI00280E073D|nr:glycosyltransferase family 4 protein [Pelagicoccus sp. SDUM812003]MDQ8204994.1 glycosyltransferase family 4 protein [Pelagicoccus sp. SDUM812003]